jgi:hypothetical protein
VNRTRSPLRNKQQQRDSGRNNLGSFCVGGKSKEAEAQRLSLSAVVVYEPNIADLRVKRAIRVNGVLLVFSCVKRAGNGHLSFTIR